MKLQIQVGAEVYRQLFKGIEHEDFIKLLKDGKVNLPASEVQLTYDLQANDVKILNPEILTVKTKSTPSGQ